MIEKKDYVIYAKTEINIYDENIEEDMSAIINDESNEDEHVAPVVRKGSKNKKYSTVSMSLRSRGASETTEELDQENDNVYMAMDGPSTFEDALNSDQSDQWLSAMQDELDSLR